MDIFLKKYKQVFKEALAGYNFKIYHRTFYRVTNDVVQYFDLWRRVPYCNIRFSILPIWIGFTKSDLSEVLYEINRFLNSDNGVIVLGWRYEPRDEGSILKAINALLDMVKGYLIPVFEKAADSSSAYRETCNLHEKFYGKIDVSDGNLIAFNLKMGNYKKAVELAQADRDAYKIAMADYFNNAKKSGFTDEEISESIKKYNESLGILEEYVKVLSTSDVGCFDEIIENNERATLINLGYLKGEAPEFRELF